MEHDEGVEQAIVAVDGLGNLRPTFGVDGTAVQQSFELKHGVPHVLGVGAQRGAQGRKENLPFSRRGPADGRDFPRRRAIIEGWPYGQA